MSRSLSAALPDRPLLFEPVPPTVRANPVRSGLAVEELGRLLREIPRLDAINIPELVDENHDGRPYYRSGDTRPFARTVAEQTGREAIVNRVVAHLEGPEALAGWIRATLEAGLRHVVLVGGSSRYIPYPGPPVLEADRIAAPPLSTAGGRLGNIAIPQRPGESHRMVAKSRAGAAFFTTQILFDPESVLKLLREYDEQARAAGIAPATVVLSFAPLADESDAEFVRWLGADITERAEHEILNGGDGSAAARSVRHALEVYATVARRAAEERWAVPLGVNVEQISQRHLASAIEMLRAFAGRISAEPSAGR